MQQNMKQRIAELESELEEIRALSELTNLEAVVTKLRSDALATEIANHYSKKDQH